MTTSPSHPRFAPRSRACGMAVPHRERLIERPESRGKLKLRGRPTVCRFAADESHAVWESPADRIHQWMSALPKCPPSGGARSATMVAPAGCSRRRPRMRLRAVIASLRPSGLSLPVAWLDYLWPSTARRPLKPRIFPCRFPPIAGTPTGIPRACACGAKIRDSEAQRCACPPLASGGSGSVSSSRP